MIFIQEHEHRWLIAGARIHGSRIMECSRCGDRAFDPDDSVEADLPILDPEPCVHRPCVHHERTGDYRGSMQTYDCDCRPTFDPRSGYSKNEEDYW